MIKISLSIFKKIINMAKVYLSKDGSRRFLGYIRVEGYKNNRLVIYACDGWRAIKIVVPASNQVQIFEDCQAHVRPLNFEVLKDPTLFITIDVDKNEDTRVIIPTQYGKVTYDFKNPHWAFNIDLVFGQNRPAEEDWVCNPAFLRSVVGDNGPCYVSIPKSRTQPAVFYSKDDTFEIEQLMLPVRAEGRKIE